MRNRSAPRPPRLTTTARARCWRSPSTLPSATASRAFGALPPLHPRRSPPRSRAGARWRPRGPPWPLARRPPAPLPPAPPGPRSRTPPPPPGPPASAPSPARIVRAARRVAPQALEEEREERLPVDVHGDVGVRRVPRDPPQVDHGAAGGQL